MDDASNSTSSSKGEQSPRASKKLLISFYCEIICISKEIINKANEVIEFGDKDNFFTNVTPNTIYYPSGIHSFNSTKRSIVGEINSIFSIKIFDLSKDKLEAKTINKDEIKKKISEIKKISMSELEKIRLDLVKILEVKPEDPYLYKIKDLQRGKLLYFAIDITSVMMVEMKNIIKEYF